MKQLALLLCLAAFGMSAQTTTTQTINSKLKLTNVPAGTANDTLLVRGADKVVKKLPKEDLFATIPTPTLDQVTAAGSSTGNAITLGFVSASQLRLNGIFGSYGELSYSNPNGWLFTGNSEPMLGANYAQITSYVPGNGYGTLDFQNLTAERYFNLPDASGTIALKEYTVGDFINDNATTMAPSMNAVYDALALKANDANVVHKTGDETIAGIKNFTSNVGIGIASPNYNLDVNGNGAFRGLAHIQLKDVYNDGNNYSILAMGGNANINSQFFGGFINNNNIGKFSQQGYSLEKDYIFDFIVNKITWNGTQYDKSIAMRIDDTKRVYASSLAGGSTKKLLYSDADGGIFPYTSVYIPEASGLLPVIRNTAPTSSTAAGVKGEIYVDANYIYYCYDTNLWRRVAGSTW